MDPMPKISTQSMKDVLHDNVTQFVEDLVSAVNDAAPGRLIVDSEEAVREAGEKFVRAAFQVALQQKVDAAEAAFPPSA